MEESVGEREIQFIVANPISVETHWILVPLTYQDFDNRYEDLRARYPNLQPFTQDNEYDQAECKLAVTSKYKKVTFNH